MSEPPQKIAYEPPDDDRPASGAPTEEMLKQEVVTGAAVTGHDPYAAWRWRDFRLFAIGFFISTIAGQMQTFAALYEIYKRTGSSLSLGWGALAMAVPMLLLTLPAGQFADTHSRRRIVLAMQLVTGASAIGLALLAIYGVDWTHAMAVMYLLLGLGGVGNVVSRPARNALLPQLVPASIFPNAVTWNATIFESATLIGPAIGGFICALPWPGGQGSIALAYLCAAVGFVICAVLTGLLPERHHRKAGEDSARTLRSAIGELGIGLRFVWGTKMILGAITLDLFAVLLGGCTFLLPVFAKDILRVGPIGLSWLRAAPSIGAISMAVFQAHRPPLRRAGRALLVAVAGFGVATTIFALSTNYWLSLVMLVLTGAVDNISVVVRHTLIQMLTPDSMRGRVSAVNQVFIGSSNELGGLESGLTGAWLGPVGSVVLGGIGAIVVVISTLFVFPEIMKIGSLSEIRPQPVPIDSSEVEGSPVAQTSQRSDAAS